MVKLYAPSSYAAATPDQRAKAVNGCGAASATVDFVPDTIYGLDISEACRIHDWQYIEGKTIQHKEEADRVFLNNLTRIVKGKGGFLEWFRMRRVLKYYNAVKYFGGSAFWEGKNPPENLVEKKSA